jgi:superfamily II DNA or RNA helicase
MSLRALQPDAASGTGGQAAAGVRASAAAPSSAAASLRNTAPRTATGTTPAPVRARCTPRLTLSAAPLHIDDGSRRGTEVQVAALRLDFDYDGAVARADDPLPRLFDPAHMARGPIPRDRAFERAARHQLETFGAIDLSTLDDCALGDDAIADYVLRIDGDVHALCAFSAYAVPQLQARGWDVRFDEAYPWQAVPAGAPLTAAIASDDRRPDWFGVELGIELDGHRVNLLPPLLELLDQTEDLAQLTRPTRRCVAVQIAPRRWLPLPPDRVKRLLTVLAAMVREGGKVGMPASRSPLIAELGVALYDEARPLHWAGDLAARDAAYALAMGPRMAPTAAPQLGELRADLRPYQREGVEWLAHLRANGASGILADDMGLGKTLQTIAHVVAEKAAGRLTRPVLVVTLTSCLGNWGREFARFAPHLTTLSLRAPDRAERLTKMAAHDVVLTTFPLLTRDREALAAQPFAMIVLDEAHTIKNGESQVAQAARCLVADHKVALTGTPVENHLGELWSVMDFLMPGSLGAADEFREKFRAPIEERGDAKRMGELRDRVRPYLLRRTKDVVAKDLPPKTELVRTVELDGAQRELYESIRVAAHADVRAHIKARGVKGSTIAILDALLKLRQACCDPRLVNLEAAQAVGSSAKLDMFLDFTTRQLAAGHRILVFSQFARMLALMSESLLGRGVRHVTLTGSTPDRQKPIDAFEQGKADVFLISLRAGGTGLNLTSADTVIHYDPWWNPAAQAQATDRAYRIGQKKPVFAYNFVVAGSVEERMLGLQAHKRKLAQAVLGDGGDGPAALSERDVDDLLAPLA